MRKFILFPLILLSITFLAAFWLRLSLLNLKPYYNFLNSSSHINSNVSIYRDNFAIPYINVSDSADFFFSLGFVHAQDRIFQMDLMRAAAKGQLSESFGLQTLNFDILFRTIALFKLAERDYNLLPQATKNALISYANGVNHFLETHNNKLPIEFSILNKTPSKWEPNDSFLISKFVAWMLNLSWWNDITLYQVANKLSPADSLNIISLSQFNNVFSQFNNFMGFAGPSVGSNNWVVSSSLSKNGKPIIANDTHLAYTIPNLWYLASVNIKNGNRLIQGATIPGAPGFFIGRNRSLSWSVTNMMTDDCDFYIEKINKTRNTYLLDSKEIPLKISKDTIFVKGENPFYLTTKSTHRGPLIDKIHFSEIDIKTFEFDSVSVSINWVGFSFSDEITPILNLNNSENVFAATNYLKDYSIPGQNFILADSSGNIAKIHAAKIPNRKHLVPNFIYDGTISDNDWNGFIPQSEIPPSFNPDSGYFATANNQINSEFYISNIWEPDSRIERVNFLLQSKNKFSLEDFKRFQSDITSPFDLKLNKFLMNAFVGVKSNSENLNIALDILKKWKGNYDIYSQTPAIFLTFKHFLIKNLFEEKLGTQLLENFMFISNLPNRIILNIFENKENLIFNIPNNFSDKEKTSILRKSLTDAIKYLSKELGNDIQDWQLSQIHKLSVKHPFSGKYKLLDLLLDIPSFPVPGSGTTLFNTEYNFKEPFENNLGPTFRMLFDFSNPDKFFVILNTGQSENFISDNYSDQTKLWLDGEYITLEHNNSIFIKNNFNLSIIKKVNKFESN